MNSLPPAEQGWQGAEGDSPPLSREHRELWTKCILASCFGTPEQRQAFIDGYELRPLTKMASESMSRRYEVGRRASILLHSKFDPPAPPSGEPS